MRAQHRTFNKAIKGLVWFEMISFVTFRLYLKRSSDCLMIFNYMRLSGAHNRGGGGGGGWIVKLQKVGPKFIQNCRKSRSRQPVSRYLLYFNHKKKNSMKINSFFATV